MPRQALAEGSWRATAFLPMMLLSAIIVALVSYVYRDALLVASHSLPLPIFSLDVIDTGYARYLGNRTSLNTVAYLGVPYAEPPLDERRFRAPVPLDTERVAREARGKIVDARAYPEFCIQGTTGSGDAGGAGSEDCLKVNIYTPVGAKRGSNLPVLVYIHGGGYLYGNPRNWPFDHWIHQSPNVVIVSVYYRLSSFGFLSTPAFRDGTLGDLNAGFLDQIQALRWVQAHIASFGGDPRKVTINGESAGGASVELHLVAEGGKEALFSGAIAQSVYRTPLPLPEQQQPLFGFYAKQAGCGQGSVAAQVACLRTASVSALARAQDAASSSAFTASGYRSFHPVVDGKVIIDYPTKSILEGKFAKVPLVVGATTNETLSGGNDVAAAMRTFFPSILDEDIHTLLGAYPVSDFASSQDLQFQTITGDSELRCARTIMGAAFGKATKSWTYRYNQPTPGAPAAYHASENYMMFQGTSTGSNGTTTFHPLSPSNEAFAAELIAYWLSFVRSGDPNTFKLPHSPVWKQYTPRSARMVLQAGPEVSVDGQAVVSGSKLEVEDDKGTARCRLVASQVRGQQN
ncbi:unnamed protein product [Cyclocybe aegerita]|uniref:Carboxylic ester hydrolase n=1 Tax=Cyclocybe aegerita TaxID=1973307 RepID=A0A8S0W967_CYCAE|nr:unnamed protein product [Cyclocybe aegerita]